MIGNKYQGAVSSYPGKGLSNRRRLLVLLIIMTVVVTAVTGITIFSLYQTSFEQQRARLVETAQSQARLMEAVARFDALNSENDDIPGGAFAATLSQIREAHRNFEGFGKTGEFTLAQREGDQIVFLLNHRYFAMEELEPVSFSSVIAEPMRQALLGKSGILVGLDYCGQMVLAAYEPVRELNLGLVAKIDLAEIRAPFIRAGLLASGFALMLILAGTLLFLRIGNPLVQRLEENEKKYRTLFESSTEGVCLQSNVFEDCNDQACRIWACEREDIIGHTPLDFSPLTQPNGRNSAEALKERIETALSGTPQFFHWQHRRKDGALIDTDLSLKAVEIGGRQFILGTIRDITERMQIQKELEKSKAWFTTIFNSSRDGIVTEENGQIVYANKAFARLYGYANPEELLGKPVSLVQSPEDNERMLEYGRRRLRGKTVPSMYEFQGKRKDGTLIDLEASVSVANITDKKYIITVIRDITERKQMEEDKAKLEAQLRQAQKLETLGTLAGGIAHDFNNILTPILGYIDMALVDLPADSQVHADLEEVEIATHRAKNLVQQILTFSRQVEQERQPMLIQHIIRESLKLLRASLPTNIEIHQNVDTTCEPILADATQVHQVFMNLCTNAFHAMRENGGVLKVELAMIEIDSRLTNPHPELHQGKYVRLTVRDNSHGMEPATMERVFEPFFTTKEVGEGTGLGLSVAHGIVKSHGGAITVESEVGKGASFKVYFPSIVVEDEKAIPVDEPNADGSEHILLVDDEEPVTKVCKRMLERQGYHVTVRTSSTEALAAFSDHPHDFDLVITDQMMPSMTGTQLAQKMLNIKADLPIILVTGFSESLTPENVIKLGIREVVLKPIKSRDLSQVIRRMLDQKQEKVT